MQRFETTKAFSKPFKPLIAAALILAVFAPSVAGQAVHLESRTILSGESEHLAVQPNSGTDSETTQHFIVQFEDSVTEQERQSLEGVELLGYVPDNAWYASASTDTINELRNSDEVRMLVDLRPDDKLSDSVNENESVVEVDVFEDVENSQAKEILQRHGNSVSHVSDNTWRVKSPSVSELAEEDAVKWIDTLPPEAESHIEDSRSLIDANVVQRDYGLTGDGMTAAVWDGGLAGDHRDLTYSGKRYVGDSAGISDHATHVAGVMLGGGVLDSSMKGVAPDATLDTYQWPTSSTHELYTETAEAVDKGAVVSQNSWGWGISSYSDMGDYGSYSRAYDAIISGERDHRPISVVFSAGNEGNDGWQSRYDTITGAGATAKNSITVGALTDSGQMTSFSSWGPTNDGRIKPDLMANGYSVTSTMPGDNYGSKSGTSISAPAVSGAVILVNQAFEEAHGTKPAPETVKAALIQTADDLNTEGPDYETGWGLVNTDDAINLVRNGQIKTGTLQSDSDQNTYKFDASDGAKFTLAWSDHPGETSASKALVNDLDLEVRDSNGNRYYPYTLNPGNPSAAADQNSDDRRNPIEQVRVPSGAGEVTVTVDAENLPAAPQDYTLVTEAQKSDGDVPSDPVDPEPLELEIQSPEAKTYSADPVMQLTTSKEADNVYWRVNNGYWYHMDQQSETEYRHTHDFSEGENTVDFYAEADGETTQESVTFELQSNEDNTPPEITVKSPEPKTYQTSGVAFSIESNEELDRAWYEVDGREGAITGSGTSFQKVVQLDDGSYTATLYGKDKAGNVASEQVSFEVDTEDDIVDPNIDIDVVSPENKVYGTNGIQFQIDVSGHHEEAYVSTDDASRHQMDSRDEDTYTYMWKGEDGEHTATFHVKDVNGDWHTKEQSFTLDTSPDLGPVEIEVASPENKTYSESPEMRLTTSREATVYWRPNNGYWYHMDQESETEYRHTHDFSEGENTVDFYAVDEEGNVDQEQVTFTIETQDNNPEPEPPAINIESPESKTYNTEGVYFSISSDKELAKAEYFLDSKAGMLTQNGDSYTDMVKLEDGQHTVEFRVEDQNGNTNTETVDFAVDTSDDSNDGPSDDPDDSPDDGNNDTEVEFEVISPESKTYQTSGIQFSIKAGEELEKAEYVLDGKSGKLKEDGDRYSKMVKLEDGEHTAEFRVEDAAGNVDTETVTFKIDTEDDSNTKPVKGPRDPGNPGNGPDSSPSDGGSSYRSSSSYSNSYSSSTVTISVGESKSTESDRENETVNISQSVSAETGGNKDQTVTAVNPEADTCKEFQDRSEVPEDWTVIDEDCNDREAQMEEQSQVEGSGNLFTGHSFMKISFDSLKNQILENLLAIKGVVTFRG